MRDLQQNKPRDWWREVKQLSGPAATGRPDLRSIMKNEDNHTNQEFVNKINKAFISFMNDNMPILDDVFVPIGDDKPIIVMTESMAQNSRQITIAKTSGPDYLPNWVLKEYVDILAPAVTDIIDNSFQECKVPKWRKAMSLREI